MTPDLFWIPGPWRGRLAVANRPRGGDWLEDEASGWRRTGLDVVVSLLEQEEVAQLDLVHEGDVAQSRSIGSFHFQFPTGECRRRCLPHARCCEVLRRHLTKVRASRSIAIGRSGLIAAGVLVSSGTDVEKAIEVVTAARGQTVPETPEQL